MRIAHPRAAAAAILFLSCAAVAAQAPTNDHCAGAIPVSLGTIGGSSVGATWGPDPTPPCAPGFDDVWYSFTAPCNGVMAAGTCAAGTNFDTVLTVWDGSGGCGALVPILCVDDFCGPPYSPLASYVTWQAVAGTTYYLSVAGFLGATGSFDLTVESPYTEFEFFTAGPGTVGYKIRGGPPGGAAFVAMTLNGFLYPYGWFNGIDIDFIELGFQLSAGYPFLVPTGAVCGDALVGPFSGLPAGLTLYGVCVGLTAGVPLPDPRYTSAPASIQIL
jgi:hypothetical protein